MPYLWVVPLGNTSRGSSLRPHDAIIELTTIVKPIEIHFEDSLSQDEGPEGKTMIVGEPTGVILNTGHVCDFAMKGV